MESNDVYALRQAVLVALADACGPTTLDRVKDHVELFGADPAALRTQWQWLLNAGYIECPKFGGGRYFRLTEKGNAQRDFVRGAADVFIWGPRAL